MNNLLEYFAGDQMAADVWLNKYAIEGEKTPEDMHWRMAKEIARIEYNYVRASESETYRKLSEFGSNFEKERVHKSLEWYENLIFKYFDRFKYIIPQGGIMSALGNPYKIQSLSNCFLIPPPVDSYGGIFKTDQQIAQLEKRRGGVGTRIDSLRPDNTPVSNAAGTSTGAHSFMERFSNTTREVAQNGRRGALMLLCHVRHPDIFKFVSKKKDRTKVTGANVSTMLTDEFMGAVEADEDFVCTFPIDNDTRPALADMDYNKLIEVAKGQYVMKIKAKELFDLIVEMAWENAEPGLAFLDRIQKYCPEGVYVQFVPQGCNPCGEQWMQYHDACRLLSANLYSLVVNPWKSNAYLDLEKTYEVFYIQQRIADNIVDLEIEYVDKIIAKIKSDPEPEDTKAVELDLWQKIRDTAKASRRTGCGFTGLADMLAALGLKYDSNEGIKMTEVLMKTKLKAELDCTIDLAILRGTFEGWDNSKEYPNEGGSYEDIGGNEFYTMVLAEFPEQTFRMMRYGRRNVNWSNLAPTGSVSVMTILDKYSNISSSGEPQFSLFHFRKRKVNAEDKSARVDEVDATGDSWQYYPVVMGAFREWYYVQEEAFTKIEDLTKEEMEYWYKLSPWFGSTANDISWEKRVEMQAVMQKYTTNAISSTINLPKNVSKEVVAGIYMEAWKQGLKGVTVYRDGCRDGVLVHEKKSAAFEYKDSTKRPKEIDADLYITTVKGKKYAVVIGKIEDKPYEIFAFETEFNLNMEHVSANHTSGKVVKVKKGKYDFINKEENNHIHNLQIIAETGEEQVLTRLLSGMLRHGAKPQFCMEQIDKCDLGVVSFAKAISRILKKYVKDGEILSRAKCKDCQSVNIRMQEGCQTCLDCGSSKCS